MIFARIRSKITVFGPKMSKFWSPIWPENRPKIGKFGQFWAKNAIFSISKKCNVGSMSTVFLQLTLQTASLCFTSTRYYPRFCYFQLFWWKNAQKLTKFAVFWPIFRPNKAQMGHSEPKNDDFRVNSSKNRAKNCSKTLTSGAIRSKLHFYALLATQRSLKPWNTSRI